MFFVRMSCHDKGVLSLRESPGQLLTQTIRFLWCDFTWGKRLTQVVCDDIVVTSPASSSLNVFCFRLCELCFSHERITGASGHKFAIFGFIRFLHIPKQGIDRLKKWRKMCYRFCWQVKNLTAGKENHHEQSAGSINHVSAGHASDAGVEKNSQLLAD